MKFTLSTLVSLTSLATAHFTLDYPPARGFDEDQLGTFPCGGQNTISSNRTTWPLAGGPIQLTMEHDHAAVQVLIALGNNPTDNFNAVLVPTTQEQGIGKFCLSDVKVPESLGVKDGDNATIQVVTNGDPTGGLYNVRLNPSFLTYLFKHHHCTQDQIQFHQLTRSISSAPTSPSPLQTPRPKNAPTAKASPWSNTRVNPPTQTVPILQPLPPAAAVPPPALLRVGAPPRRQLLNPLRVS